MSRRKSFHSAIGAHGEPLLSQRGDEDRPVLRDGGFVSAEEAKAHVKAQYRIFDDRRRLALKERADAELAALKAEAKKLPKARKSNTVERKVGLLLQSSDSLRMAVVVPWS
jgi:hypothetical protein